MELMDEQERYKEGVIPHDIDFTDILALQSLEKLTSSKLIEES